MKSSQKNLGSASFPDVLSLKTDVDPGNKGPGLGIDPAINAPSAHFRIQTAVISEGKQVLGTNIDSKMLDVDPPGKSGIKGISHLDIF